jgi:hypothetical protein
VRTLGEFNKRDFMSRVVAWPGDDAPGYVNLHWLMPDQNDPAKSFWVGKPTKTVEEFAKLADWAGTRSNIRDIYYCTSLQAKTKQNNHGKTVAYRRQEEALAMKAIWLDVDVKEPPKGYATLEEAMEAIHSFIKVTGLPPASALVGSGGGVHVYWISDRGLSPELWRSYAHGLKTAAIQHALRCDAGVTIDSARVLRVPDTLNYKTDPPLPVKLLELRAEHDDYNFAVDLAHLAIPVTPKASGAANVIPFPFDMTNLPKQAFRGPSDDSLADGIQREKMPPLDFAPLVKGCTFIRDALKTGGKDYSQSMWNLTTLAATFLENGETLAHRMGNQHPGYTKESTDAMWERKTRERTELGLGWPSCNAIRDAGCTKCDSCPRFTLGKSPLHLGLQELPRSPSAGHLGGDDMKAIDPASYRVSFSNIPHRKWLYGVDFVRGDITLLASPGGAGKTSYALGVAACVATGKSLLGEQIWGKDELKSLYINAEDSGVEMRRRTWAFCQQHGITEQELDRLYVAGTDDPWVRGLSFLRAAGPNSSVLDQAGFKHLADLIASLRPDLVVIDPLIALCGGGNVNDNAAMSLVMREVKNLAIKFNCAILIVLHTRKGGDLTNADAISGASAVVNLARRAIMPATMTEPEAKNFGLLPSERLSYLKLVDAKSNLAPLSAETPWYKLVNIELPNIEPPTYPHGDRVQAIERAKLNTSYVSFSPGLEQQAIRFEILKLIDRGLVIGGEEVPYSPNSTGKNKMRAILDDAMASVKRASVDREYAPRDLRAVAERELEALKHEGWVIVEPIKKGRFRRNQGLRPVWERTPWAKERENLHRHGGPTLRTEDEEQELDHLDLENP